MMKSTIRTFVVALLVSGVLLATPAMVQAQDADDDDEAVLAEIRSLLDRISRLLDSIDAAFAKLDDDTLPPPTTTPPTTELPGGVGSVSGVGSYSRTGTEQYDELSLDIDHLGQFSGTRDTYSYSGWGVWGSAGGATLFRATISGTNIRNGVSTALLDPYYTSVTGLRSFDNPVGRGTAVWTGDVRAYETHPDTFGVPVEGDARLEMDLDGFLDTIDVDFTNFDRGHSNMRWSSVFVNSIGGFRAYYPGELEGSFYGDDHEGVAGTFDGDGLRGVFGAVRQ